MSVGGKVTSLAKSEFYRPQLGFGYGYWVKFRDQNSPNIDKGILKVSGNFEATEQRNASGIISIRVDDLLISGGEFLQSTFPRERAQENFEVGSDEGDRATYLGMAIGKCVVLISKA